MRHNSGAVIDWGGGTANMCIYTINAPMQIAPAILAPGHPGPVIPCTCAALRRLTRQVTAVYDRHLAPAGLTTNQYSLLMTLAQGAMPLGRLARRAAADRTTLTRALAPLARTGLVRLDPGADARQRVARLTPEGEARLRLAQPAWARAQALLETTLGAESVQAMHALIADAMTQLRPLLPRN